MPWLLFETVAEARAIFRMFVDPRYRLSWTGRLLPVALVVLFATSGWWAGCLTSINIFYIGAVLNKVLDLALGFVLFKVLGHEARRYRQTSPDLPPSLRL
jgi:hypothetical protein